MLPCRREHRFQNIRDFHVPSILDPKSTPERLPKRPRSTPQTFKFEDMLTEILPRSVQNPENGLRHTQYSGIWASTMPPELQSDLQSSPISQKITPEPSKSIPKPSKSTPKPSKTIPKPSKFVIKNHPLTIQKLRTIKRGRRQWA